MKNPGTKKLVIIMIIVIAIIIAITIGLIFLNSNKDTKNVHLGASSNNTQTEDVSTTQKEEEQKISTSKYYNIGKVVRAYLGALDKSKYILSDGTNYSDDESIKQYIFDMLSTEYIEKNNVTVENVYDNVKDLEETVTFVPLNMKVEQGLGVDKFLVYGDIVYMNSNKLEKTYLIVNIDNINNTFSIEPVNEEIDNMENYELQSVLTEIKKNNSNTFNNQEMSDEDISKEKFNNLKLLILRKSEDLFNSLNKEYREKKFGDYNGFSQYIDTNYDRLQTINLSKYQVTNDKGYEEYILLDEDDRYYIFKGNSNNQDEIYLDTYTVDLPEFLEKYNSSDDGYKVGYNIEKFFNAINDKDYKYAYNVLDDVFKQNNYPNQSDFENFVKSNFYENNKVNHKNVEQEGNLFVYNISIQNKENLGEQKNLTVIMKLEEGTDFVMSFSIDN